MSRSHGAYVEPSPAGHPQEAFSQDEEADCCSGVSSGYHRGKEAEIHIHVGMNGDRQHELKDARGANAESQSHPWTTSSQWSLHLGYRGGTGQWFLFLYKPLHQAQNTADTEVLVLTSMGSTVHTNEKKLTQCCAIVSRTL